VILEKEWFLDSILLKFAELDNQANGAGQRLFNDEILLSSNLLSWSELQWEFSDESGCAYRFQQSEQFSFSLVGNFARVNRLRGGICSHHILKRIVLRSTMTVEHERQGRSVSRVGFPTFLLHVQPLPIRFGSVNTAHLSIVNQWWDVRRPEVGGASLPEAGPKCGAEENVSMVE
jgi:hypothetical protein